MKIVRRLLITLMLAVFLLAIVSFWLVTEAANKYPLYYNELIVRYAEEYDLDPFLIAAVIKVESNYNPEVTSHMNAHGLMQILPETGRWVANRWGEDFHEDRIMEPDYNIKIGTYYLSYLMDYFGEEQLVLAAYNGGPANVSQWLDTPEYSADGKHLDFIPFQETDNYVTKVSEYYKIYRDVYHEAFPENERDVNNPLDFNSRNYKSFLLKASNIF